MEIQGRTLFEEGWSEIDHDIVYPYFKDDEMLKDFSTLLNRLSGMADEMSSYFRRMKSVREEPGKNRKERRALTGGGNIWTEQEERERKIGGRIVLFWFYLPDSSRRIRSQECVSRRHERQDFFQSSGPGLG